MKKDPSKSFMGVGVVDLTTDSVQMSVLSLCTRARGARLFFSVQPHFGYIDINIEQSMLILQGTHGEHERLGRSPDSLVACQSAPASTSDLDEDEGTWNDTCLAGFWWTRS